MYHLTQATGSPFSYLLVVFLIASKRRVRVSSSFACLMREKVFLDLLELGLLHVFVEERNIASVAVTPPK